MLSHTTTVGKLVTMLQLPKAAKLPSAAKPLSLVSSLYLAKLSFVGKLPSSATLPSSDSFRATFLTKLLAAGKADMLPMRLSHEVTCRSEGKHAFHAAFLMKSPAAVKANMPSLENLSSVVTVLVPAHSLFGKVTDSKPSPCSWQLQVFGDVALFAGYHLCQQQRRP